MPVGTAARHKSKEIDERANTMYVFGAVAWMFHFDSIQSRVYERLEARAECIRPRMRPHGYAARLMRHRDCLTHFDSILWYESRSPRAEITIERLAKIVDRPTA